MKLNQKRFRASASASASVVAMQTTTAPINNIDYYYKYYHRGLSLPSLPALQLRVRPSPTVNAIGSGRAMGAAETPLTPPLSPWQSHEIRAAPGPQERRRRREKKKGKMKRNKAKQMLK